MQRSEPSGLRRAARRGVAINVVSFWTGAPNAQKGNETDSVEATDESASISGMSHIGPCRASMKCGVESSPRSMGFSKQNSAPEPRAERSTATVRCTMRLAMASSLACAGGGTGNPRMCSRSRTGGAPGEPSSFGKNPIEGGEHYFDHESRSVRPGLIGKLEQKKCM